MTALIRRFIQEFAFYFAAILIATTLTNGTPTMANDNKMIIAHRGASGYLPEHTLAAKAMAHAMGADFIEQDVVLTKDGVPVILHDIHLDTVTDVENIFPDRRRDDGRYYVIDFTLAEIKTLSVHERTKRGSNTSVFPGRFPQSKSTFRVPTLVEEIELIQGLNKTTGRVVGIYPEIKAPQFHHDHGFDLANIVINILNKYGYKTKTDPVILQCFNWQENKRIRNELGFKARMIQLLGENRWGISKGSDFDYLKSKEGLQEMAKTVDGIGPWVNQVVSGMLDGNPQLTDLIDNAHNAGLLVHPYTARADKLPKWASSFDELISIILQSADADGVFTDFPDLAVKSIR